MPASTADDVTDGVIGGGDGGPWTTVDGRKGKRSSNSTTQGKTIKSSFLGAPLRRDFYLFNIEADTENSSIEQFLKINGINTCWLRQVSSNVSFNKSFRLTVLESDEDKVNSISWPDRVYLKKWRFKSSNGFDRKKANGQNPDTSRRNSHSIST